MVGIGKKISFQLLCYTARSDVSQFINTLIATEPELDFSEVIVRLKQQFGKNRLTYRDEFRNIQLQDGETIIQLGARLRRAFINFSTLTEYEIRRYSPLLDPTLTDHLLATLERTSPHVAKQLKRDLLTNSNQSWEQILAHAEGLRKIFNTGTENRRNATL